ncbi:MAG: GAF domain-containing SpoIIE family protein phosphatase [bacterium]
MAKQEPLKSKTLQLDEKLFELQALFDLSKALNSSLDLKSILDTILLTPMGRMLIGKGMVLIARGHGGFAIETVKGLPKKLVGMPIEIDDFPNRPSFVEHLRPSLWNAFLQKHEIIIAIPIKHDDKNLGVIAFGKKIIGSNFNDSELEYLYSLSNIAATAVQNSLMFHDLRTVNRQLDKKVQELNTLFEIGKELNSALKTNRIVNLLAYAIMGEMTVNRCLIFLKTHEGLVLSVNKGFGDSDASQITADPSCLAALEKQQEPFLVEERNGSPDLALLQKLRIAAVIPMRTQNETMGIIALGEKITKLGFARDELEFLTTLGNLSMISIENARLFEETLEKQRLEEELLIARDIQKQLLPTACPNIENYEIAATNISSRQVGGDYYDCIQINDRQYGFCIADVSGKGAPAALLMANLQASLHALISTDLTIEDMTAKINNIIYRNTTCDKFITYFFGILDLQEETFTYVNAGHNPPFLFHQNGSFDLLQEGGLILGMMPDVIYEKDTVKLEAGDLIVMFTDGVSEAKDADDEEFEEQRIAACVLENLHRPCEEVLKNLITAVYEFSKGQPQADDITCLIMKKTEGSTSH